MKRLWALSWKELLLLSRDPHGLLVLFAVPALFILIMSLALRDAFAPGTQAALPLQWTDQDGGALALELGDAVRSMPGFVQGSADPPQVQVQLLPGFSELLATRLDFAPDYLKGEPEPELLRIDYAPTLLPQARAAAGQALRQAVQSVQTRYLLEEVLGYPHEKIAAMRYVNDPRRLPVAEGFLGAQPGAAAPTAVQQSVPAWLIFALFFSVIPLATGFVVERMEGSLLRLRALDVSPALMLGAKALPFYLVNLLQMGVMLAIGVWLVPALGGEALRLPAAPFALWLIGSATSLAALGLALLVAVCVRTTTQATIAGGAISLILAAIGGVMVPKLIMPPAMQTVATLSPMSWALEGYWDLLLRGLDWRAVLPEAGALALFGLAALALAALLFRRMQ
ncbi:MAG TPA: ABC transporter permease [Solimonas sp.]|nr:ABC transporter permease [Solimonas sp.]